MSEEHLDRCFETAELLWEDGGVGELPQLPEDTEDLADGQSLHDALIQLRPPAEGDPAQRGTDWENYIFQGLDL